jgi:hypothetical protein
MKDSAPIMTREQWMQAIKDGSHVGVSREGLTTKEWATRTGCSVNRTREWLRLGLSAGWLCLGSRPFVRIDGKSVVVPVYELIRGVEHAKRNK